MKSKALTFRPSRIRRKRKHGYRKRNQTRAGRRVIKKRRRKGRYRLVL